MKPDLATRPTNAITGTLYDLGKHVGPIWIGIGVSVAAYLVGSVSQSISQPLYSSVDRLLRLLQGNDVRYGEVKATSIGSSRRQLIITTSSLLEIEKLQQAALAKLIPYAEINEIDGELGRIQHEVRSRALEADKGLAFELGMPATLLIGKEHELFTEADRLKAESELRFTIALPLAAILIYLVISSSIWWLLGLAPVAILVYQAYLRSAEFKSLMLGAVQRGVIQSQSVEEFRFWVSNLPADGRPPTAERPLEDGTPAT